jgi:DNA-binding NtrC family response regulator
MGESWLPIPIQGFDENTALYWIESAAKDHANVLILGETGTGKSLLARYIHSKDPRRPTPTLNFVQGRAPKNGKLPWAAILDGVLERDVTVPFPNTESDVTKYRRKLKAEVDLVDEAINEGATQNTVAKKVNRLKRQPSRRRHKHVEDFEDAHILNLSTDNLDWRFEPDFYRRLYAERKSGAFVETNLVAAGELAGSELFGHVKGAFTGAEMARTGKIVEADLGLLFIDELSHIPTRIQAQLLVTMETGTVRPLGSQEKDKIENLDVWYVGAASGPVLPELAYRLGTFVFYLPPLREVRHKIKILADVFLKEQKRSFEQEARDGLVPDSFSEEALDFLSAEQQQWPGNIRQLKNIVRLVSLTAAVKTEPIKKEDVERALKMDPMKYLASGIDIESRLRGVLHDAAFLGTPFTYVKVSGILCEEYLKKADGNWTAARNMASISNPDTFAHVLSGKSGSREESKRTKRSRNARERNQRATG